MRTIQRDFWSVWAVVCRFCAHLTWAPKLGKPGRKAKFAEVKFDSLNFDSLSFDSQTVYPHPNYFSRIDTAISKVIIAKFVHSLHNPKKLG